MHLSEAWGPVGSRTPPPSRQAGHLVAKSPLMVLQQKASAKLRVRIPKGPGCVWVRVGLRIVTPLHGEPEELAGMGEDGDSRIQWMARFADQVAMGMKKVGVRGPIQDASPLLPQERPRPRQDPK